MNEFGLMPVAVRVLPGCVECVRKCLREGLFYYLNNDYEISQDGKSIIRRRRQIEPVDSYFFRTDNDTSLSVNLSAIVGMNGDGKSSLVELIVRLLNNYALKSERHPELTLIKAEGVRAEFYYKLNGHFYCLIEDEEGIRILRYDDIGEGEFISDTPLDKSEVNDEFFLRSYRTTLIMHTIRKKLITMTRCCAMMSIGCTMFSIRMTVIRPH
ncbi:MAG: hypothetical protein K2O38_05170 [Muribaculaceae bacterium]|nr:hypothetical protein [Muribaculaceae bacterium]